VTRPRLEVADIFRRHGPAWRNANAGHVSLGQLKVMSAIESCRTAALGGHVARCDDCAHIDIAYNSCRNRHCPKCQGAAAKQWLAEREADLLPVPYYHMVFTLPAPVADIAYQNKAAIYDILFKASAETLSTIAADPKHLGARIGITSVLHTWGSALTHHPHVHMIVPGGGISPDGQRWVACRPGFFLPVRVLSRLFRRLFLDKLAAAHAAGRLKFFGDHAALAAAQAFAAYLAPLRKTEWVVYAKKPFGGPQAVLAYLSRYTHRVAIANSRLSLSKPDRLRPQRRHLQVEGLSQRRAGALQGHDARDRRVHPPLPQPCAARRLPPHPSLRPVCQRHAHRQYRPRPPTPRLAAAPAPSRLRCRDRRQRAKDAPAALSLLRRPHDHHRDLPARHHPTLPAGHAASRDQDRHVVTKPRLATRQCRLFLRWSSTRHAGARPNHAPRLQSLLRSSSFDLCKYFNNRNNQPITHPQANHPCHPSSHRHSTSCAATAKSP
jgi:hypothetical protein